MKKPNFPSDYPYHNLGKDCAICREVFSDPAQTKPCDHVFDHDCLKIWFKAATEQEQDKICPMCRMQVTEVYHDFTSQGTFSVQKVKGCAHLPIPSSTLTMLRGNRTEFGPGSALLWSRGRENEGGEDVPQPESGELLMRAGHTQSTMQITNLHRQPQRTTQSQEDLDPAASLTLSVGHSTNSQDSLNIVHRTWEGTRISTKRQRRQYHRQQRRQMNTQHASVPLMMPASRMLNRVVRDQFVPNQLCPSSFAHSQVFSNQQLAERQSEQLRAQTEAVRVGEDEQGLIGLARTAGLNNNTTSAEDVLDPRLEAAWTRLEGVGFPDTRPLSFEQCIEQVPIGRIVEVAPSFSVSEEGLRLGNPPYTAEALRDTLDSTTEATTPKETPEQVQQVLRAMGLLERNYFEFYKNKMEMFAGSGNLVPAFDTSSATLHSGEKSAEPKESSMEGIETQSRQQYDPMDTVAEVMQLQCRTVRSLS